ncbi:MAG: fumarate hydratase, partial [Candidatus Sericytochromatia bacterium]|nr:fumarate hydratase [Candidatus Tanganyikabacteria bacterium]
MATTEFQYQDPFPLGEDHTRYRLVTKEGVRVVDFDGAPVLKIDPAVLTLVANEALRDVSFLLRAEHNEAVARILADP